MTSKTLLRSLNTTTLKNVPRTGRRNTLLCLNCHHRTIATATANAPSTSNSEPQQSSAKPLTPEQKEFLDRALRVNQAGEYAAELIYRTQTPPIVTRYPHLRPLMAHMHAQEASHLVTFNQILGKHRVRPTALAPVWGAAATALGWATGVMGREAAMAATEAVETVIGEHYNEQVRELLRWAEEDSGCSEGEAKGEMGELLRTLRRIRDEELEHLDHAVEEDAKLARPYEVLNGVIKAGCRGAIWVCERV